MTNIFDVIRIPIGWILQFCYKLVPNYMVALLLFALIMQILLLPFAIKQQKNSIKQASLQPKVSAIRKKYAGRTDKATQQKMQQETMELYQKENFNMMGGCLPLLIQMPILFALFSVIICPIRFLCGYSADVAQELVDLYAPMMGTQRYYQIGLVRLFQDGTTTAESVAKDIQQAVAEFPDKFAHLADLDVNALFTKLPDFKLFGGKIDLSMAPQEAGLKSWMIIIPIVTVIALIFSQIFTKKFTYQAPESQDAQNNCSMKLMLYSMPLLSGYFAYLYAAAIGIYWIFRNLLSLAQQVLLAKFMPIPKFTEADYKAAEKEILGNNRPNKTAYAEKNEEAKKNPKSLHYIDDDDDETYVDNGRVTRYDDDDAEVPSNAPSSVKAAPMKDDKDTKYTKK